MKQDRELVVVLAEAEQQTVAAINCIMQENGLPCFLMETIVAKIHRQLIDEKAAELSAAKSRENRKEQKGDGEHEH
jgi:hypothetical protein